MTRGKKGSRIYSTVTMRSRSPLRMLGSFVVLGLLTSGCAMAQARYAQETPVIPALPQTSLVYDATGTLITALHEAENRTNIELKKVPKHTRDAVLAIEDARFYDHHGIDLRALIRAAVENAKSGRIVQGGSTITEQLVKNTITGDDRTLDRKIREAILAYKLEDELTKDEIFQKYLNTVYFGRGAYGIQAAAKTYFSVSAWDLDLAQGALLAGLIRSPGDYDPVEHPRAAASRRDQVLYRMRVLGWLDKDTYLELKGSKLRLKLAKQTGRYQAAYFLNHVKRWFLANDRFGASFEQRNYLLFQGGLRIHTTVDLTLQRYAEEAVNSILIYPNDPYGAMTVIDPRTGHIKAMVGGRDFFDEDNKYAKVNLATGAGGSGRQAGSAFKPFALVAALENGIPPQKVYPAPATVEIPMPPGSEEAVWEVGNYDGSGRGKMNLEEATINSVNTVYAQLIRDLGKGNPNEGGEKVVQVARRMGVVRRELRTVASAALGTNEVDTLDMASAYGPLATMGQHFAPVAVTRITDAHGKVLFEADPAPRQVVHPGVAWTATQILSKAVQFGTGTAANLGRPQAGKTGTAQQWRDAWFVGYIPQLVAAVWVGFPQGQIEMAYPTVRIPHVLGGTWPAQIWHAFMVNATRTMPIEDFPEPDLDYVTVRIDITRGCLPNEFTLPKNIRSVKFIKGTEPTEKCDDDAQEVPVPSVVGLSKDEAVALLESYGFSAAVERREDSRVEPGTVLAQHPSAGSEALQGSSVTIVVAERPKDEPSPTPTKSPTPTPSKTPKPSPSPSPSPTETEPPTSTVPNVVGLSKPEAVERLRAAGFDVAVVRERCGCGAEPNSVFDQSPPGGEEAEEGTTVTIYVNRSRR